MSKKEFIKLLETLDFEELKCATISYYKKKPSQYGCYDEDYEPKTICIGNDLEKSIQEKHSYTCNLLENVFKRINDLEKNKGE